MLSHLHSEAVVIGGGVAGMAAALEIHRHGLSVLMIDDHSRLGGHRAQPPQALERALRAAGLPVLLGASVFAKKAVFANKADFTKDMTDSVLVETSDGDGVVVTANRWVLANGAVERPTYVPGWTAPGVIGLRALHAAVADVAHGKSLGRVIFAGCGAGLWAAVAAYNQPVAVVSWDEPVRWIKRLGLRWAGVRLAPAAQAVRVEVTAGRVSGLSWSDDRGQSHHLEADTVVLSSGQEPDLTLPRAFGVPVRWHPDRRRFLPESDAHGATPVPRVWLAGSVQGDGQSLMRGRLAGFAVAVAAGRARSGPPAVGDGWRWRQSSSPALKPADSLPLSGEVIVCRCQGITAGRLREAAKHGATGANLSQALTGCAVGTCQGRLCGTRMAEVLAGAVGETPAEIGLPRARQLIRPVSLGLLGELARLWPEEPLEL